MANGYFCTIEGIEGAGKSTLIEGLSRGLIAQGRSVLCLREPGGTPAGDQIRQLLLDPNIGLTPRAELLLFNASRAHLVESMILPATAKGQVVLCDRFADSTRAYQGAARGVSQVILDAALNLGTLGLAPDLTLLVDLDPSEGLRRANIRRGQSADDRFEGEKLSFHQAVRQGFLTIAKKEPQRFHVLDGSLPPSALLEEALNILLAKLAQNEADSP